MAAIWWSWDSLLKARAAAKEDARSRSSPPAIDLPPARLARRLEHALPGFAERIEAFSPAYGERNRHVCEALIQVTDQDVGAARHGGVHGMLSQHEAELRVERTSRQATDAQALHQKLGDQMLPLYYDDRPGWLRVMKNCICKNASFFNSHRMLRRYVTEAYLP